MSNIYIQEPPTSGKVILKTTVGDIDVELWCREAPKACRNFIQLCMEKYYDNTMFHRLVKGFIIQGGDPNGDGTGGESIYGEPFKDEFHSRLRFTRRGLVAMANSERNDNGSQFFFTLAETPELQNKNTIFGKVAGDTIYNMLKMEEGIIDENERPLYPHKIIKTEILLNPFDDIMPRQKPKRGELEDRKNKNSRKKQGIKNFGLLSFGEEAEEDEVETNTFVQKLSGKAKSTHDVLDDPKLSKETELTNINNVNDVESDLSDDDKPSTSLKTIIDKSMLVTQLEEKKRLVQEKLNSKINKNNKNKLIVLPKENVKKSSDTDSTSSSDTQDYLNEGHKLKRKLEVNDIREKIKTLKKEYQRDKKVKMELVNAAEQQKQNNENVKKIKIENKVMFNEFVEEQKKYMHLKETIPKKSAKREQLTLELLTKFRNKLEKIKEEKSDDVAPSQKESTKLDLDNDDDIKGDDWLSHTLRFEENENILAKDASTKQDDWYDVYDPRNPINKRKRGEGSRHQNKQFK